MKSAIFTPDLLHSDTDNNNIPRHTTPDSLEEFEVKWCDDGVKVARHQITWALFHQTESFVQPNTQLKENEQLNKIFSE